MQRVSTPIWHFFCLSSLFDFPWRMLLFTTLASHTFLHGLLEQYQKPIRTGVMIFLIALAVRSNLNHIQINAI